MHVGLLAHDSDFFGGFACGNMRGNKLIKIFHRLVAGMFFYNNF